MRIRWESDPVPKHAARTRCRWPARKGRGPGLCSDAAAALIKENEARTLCSSGRPRDFQNEGFLLLLSFRVMVSEMRVCPLRAHEEVSGPQR